MWYILRKNNTISFKYSPTNELFTSIVVTIFFFQQINFSLISFLYLIFLLSLFHQTHLVFLHNNNINHHQLAYICNKLKKKLSIIIKLLFVLLANKITNWLFQIAYLMKNFWIRSVKIKQYVNLFSAIDNKLVDIYINY